MERELYFDTNYDIRPAPDRFSSPQNQVQKVQLSQQGQPKTSDQVLARKDLVASMPPPWLEPPC